MGHYDCDYCGGWCFRSGGEPGCSEYERHRVKNLPNQLVSTKKDLAHFKKELQLLKYDSKLVKSKSAKEHIRSSILDQEGWIKKYTLKIREIELEIDQRNMK